MKTLVRICTLMLASSLVASAGINVSSPANGATVSTSPRITATATSTTTSPITAMAVYVDNVKVHTAYSASLDTTLSLSAGTHSIVVQAWDGQGTVQKSALTVTASTSSSVTSPTTTTTGGVIVSSPANGATVSTSTRVVASAASTTGKPISAMGIYVDGVRVFTVYSSQLDTTLTLNTGTRHISVQAWDSVGTVYKSALSLNVTSSTSLVVPSTAIVKADIEEYTGWQSCDKCAGIGGDGPTTPYSMKQYVASPSLDGRGAEFWLGGDTPYAQALWWKQLGGHPTARNFIYEMDFYMTNPSASQALEFDVNQSLNGKKYIFGTECNLKETKTWRVWDPANVKWINTGIGCALPQAYKWTKLVWEFQRTSDDKVKYISVSVNGVKRYVNMTFSPKIVNAYEVNVAFQMDGDYKQTDYSTWVDNVKLTYW